MTKQKRIAWWERNRLRVIVFTTGAAVLVVEIAATRILSPHYGNTIYSVSSVISVILAALSVGYWRGGIKADKTPTYHEFYKIIFKGGISLFALFIMALTLLPAMSEMLTVKTGPLVWSIVLFFAPGYLLGMLSPFAIKLGAAANTHMGLGEMSGNIFFWSTAGSIVGSLLAGFVLIPYLGLNTIMAGTAVVVILLGGCGMMATSTGGKRRDTAFVLTLLLIAIGVSYYIVQTDNTNPRIRLMKDGIYERLTVIDTMHAGRPARFFLQDKSASGGMFLDGRDHPFDYTKYYALHRLTTPELKSALVIGAGIYTIPKSLHEDNPDAIIDVVEIEPELESIAKTYFELPDTPKIRSHIMDGRGFLQSSQERYDLIFSDVYHSLYSVPTHFTTKEFFQAAAARLAPNGIFLANVIGDGVAGEESLLFSEVRTMYEAFPYVYIFGSEGPHSTDVQNFILVGMNEPLSPTLPERISASADPFLSTLNAHLFSFTPVQLAQYDVLTDNFAPIDHLVTKFIGKKSGEGKLALPTTRKRFAPFSGANAMTDITTVVGLGSRAVGTDGNKTLRTLIHERMKQLGLPTTEQAWTHTAKDGRVLPLANIVARYNPEARERVIIGTHYDSIARAYRDPVDPNGYMPGANNSASGVALLLEAARLLAASSTALSIGVDIIFFDGEEGELGMGAGDPNWKPLGSPYFATNISTYYPDKKPESAAIFDMVCDRDLILYKEAYSEQYAKKYQDRFFGIGGAFAPTQFIHEVSAPIGDDHLALIAAGIPAFLVIDFNYEPWWNTTKDTPERCHAGSLTLVGETLMHYLSYN